MADIDRIGLLTKDQRQHAIAEVIGWFLKERDFGVSELKR